MSDHDPFDSFKAAMSTDLHPLPATEVRRRGDRLRRRNTALAVVGGTVAAMTAVGVPLALAQGGGSTDSQPQIATEPTTSAPTWRTEIPTDFPLTAGFPGPEAGGRTTTGPYQPQAVGPCAGPAWDVSAALDSLAAVYQDPSQGGLDRVLSVYRNDAAAAQRLAELRTAVEDCQPQGQPRVDAELLVSDLGEESVAFVNAYDAGAAILHEVVRVGNAVLYSTSTFMGAGDPDVVEQSRELAQQRSASAVAQMCVFSADPC